MTTNQKCGLLIPVHNEEKIIPDLLSALKEFRVKNNSVINNVTLIDDHSDDKTKELILIESKNQPWIRLISNKNPMNGYGSAISYGLKFLKKEGYDWVAIIDSDLSNPLNQAQEMLVHCQNLDSSRKIALVKANRFWGNKVNMVGVPFNRKIFSILANVVARILSLNVSPDPTNGFRAIHVPSYPDFEPCVGFDSILQEIYQMKKAEKSLGYFNVRLRADIALRNTTSFSYRIVTLMRYLRWNILIGLATIRTIAIR